MSCFTTLRHDDGDLEALDPGPTQLRRRHPPAESSTQPLLWRSLAMRKHEPDSKLRRIWTTSREQVWVRARALCRALFAQNRRQSIFDDNRSACLPAKASCPTLGSESLRSARPSSTQRLLGTLPSPSHSTALLGALLMPLPTRQRSTRQGIKNHVETDSLRKPSPGTVVEGPISHTCWVCSRLVCTRNQTMRLQVPANSKNAPCA